MDTQKTQTIRISIVDEDAAKVVRDIFKWFLEGVSKCAIAKRLNDYGVPNPSNYKRQNGIKYKNPHQKENDDGLWSRMTISRMLANEVYIGVMIQGKQKVVSYKIHDRVSIPKEQWVRVQDAMPALISLEQFEKVQALVAKNTRVTKRSGTLTLLAGFLKCADCRKAMRRHSSGKSQSVKYYCRSHCDKGACSSHSINESDLETSVFKAIKAQMKLVENLQEMIEHIHAKPSMNAQPDRLNAMIDTKRKELQKMKAINDEVYMDWKKRIIEQDSYDRIKEKNDRQISQINDAIAKMEEELRMCSGNTSTHPVFVAFAKYANIAQLDREVLAALIDVIYVHENKEITIIFRHDDSVQAVQGFIKDHLGSRKKPA